MKVAYVFANAQAATRKLSMMILPQLEQGMHGVEVVGMFFFDDNLYVLRKDNPVGERLAKVAREQGIMLMICDRCAVERNMAEGTFEQCGRGEVAAKDTVAGVQAGCFPQLYAGLATNPPDQVITL